MLIGYLGPVELSDGGQVTAVPGARLGRLLVQLARDPGRWVSAGVLAEAVWADGAPADPANSLQSLVSRLRRTLGRAELVEQSPAGYRLTLAPDDVDAIRFTRLADQGRAALTAGDDAAAGTALDAALALWRGAPLADDDGVEAAAHRSALTDRWVGACADRAALLVRAGRAGEVTGQLEALQAAHPLREDVAGVLIDALVAAGRPGDALAGYQRTRTALAEALGADPSPALRERHLAVLRQDALTALPPGNLPSGVTSFLGREDDVAQLVGRLGASRLVSVVGAGGAGKTRLATEVATRVRDGAGPAVPDGVWFVELAPVTDPAALAAAVLEAMELRELAVVDAARERPRDARVRLLDALRPAACLLVLDNCEHVVDAMAELVAELLGRCAGVRVLATSREPLGIDGEALHPLSPLRVPPDGVPLAEAAGWPAVRLALDRARAVRPGIELDDALVEVARRLDGLPLAIELAAARMRVLTAAEVATKLADRFGLLTGGRRTAAPRHRTLRAVVAWSWDLLTPLEREVAEHVSVFASGAHEQAVAAVCPSSPAAIADVLHALVDKSLLLADHTPAGTRFRMLETLREYAAEQLTAQGTAAAARAAHARWVRALVAADDARLRTPAQLPALHRLDAEHDEVLAALAHLTGSGDAAGALELATGLSWYWLLRESGDEGERWLAAALAVPGAAAHPLAPLAQSVLLVLGVAGLEDREAQVPQHPDERRAVVGELVRRLTALQDDVPLVRVLRPLLQMLSGASEQATALVAEALLDPDPWIRAAVRLVRINAAENAGDVAGMRADLDTAVEEWQALGDRWGLSAALTSRGEVRTMDGDLAGAAADYERAQTSSAEMGGTTDRSLVLMHLVELRVRDGDLPGARTHLAGLRGLAPGDRPRGLIGRVLSAVAGATVALADGDPAVLQDSWAELSSLVSDLGDPGPNTAHGGAFACSIAAQVAVRLGDPDTAHDLLQTAYRVALQTDDHPVIAGVGLSGAVWAAHVGLALEAATLVGATDRVRGAEDPTNPATVRLLAGLRGELGDQLDTARAAGRALDPEDAVRRLDPALLLSAQALRR